ncbi:TraR/DksA C4-type zinc finger protein [Streptomyces sp. NPDC028635]|uniref:TraR/DksA family transcriptional regulator n=1 Tax=Streptomyces sp. NPDC028635 TaxID=3154800 RepID=UPI0033D16699
MTLDATRAEPHLHEARRRLERARTSRLAQLHALDETGRSSRDDHLLSAQRTAMEGVLKEIEEAFTRLQDGSYGTCLECAEPIPAERLEILPYTRHCVACRRRTA